MFFVEGNKSVIYVYFSRQILKIDTAHLIAKETSGQHNSIDLRLMWIYLPSLASSVSIPVTVIGIFLYLNPSDRNMALGSTQPLTEMSTRNVSKV